MTVLVFVVLGIAGGLGSALRFLVDDIVREKWGSAFPWATLIVNLTGSFALGVLLAAPAADPVWAKIIGTGLLGGYTTLSTASVDVVRLLMARRTVLALCYGFGGLILILGVAMLGILLGSGL